VLHYVVVALRCYSGYFGTFYLVHIRKALVRCGWYCLRLFNVTHRYVLHVCTCGLLQVGLVTVTFTGCCVVTAYVTVYRMHYVYGYVAYITLRSPHGRYSCFTIHVRYGWLRLPRWVVWLLLCIACRFCYRYCTQVTVTIYTFGFTVYVARYCSSLQVDLVTFITTPRFPAYLHLFTRYVCCVGLRLPIYHVLVAVATRYRVYRLLLRVTVVYVVHRLRLLQFCGCYRYGLLLFVVVYVLLITIDVAVVALPFTLRLFRLRSLYVRLVLLPVTLCVLIPTLLV